MVSIEHLYKSFGRKAALNDFSLTLGSGITGLLGQNGAGKTTLLRTLMGLYPVKRGRILLDGKEVTNTKALPAMSGYLPQLFGGFAGLRVREFLEYMADLKKCDPQKRGVEIDDCLARTNLESRADDKIGSLSGGMVRRLGIAQAILGCPKLMIFDEPTAGLDPEERIRFRNLILQLPKDRTILISTHIVDDVASLCDTVAVMYHGRCVADTACERLTTDAAGHVFEIPEGLTVPEGAVVSGISTQTRRVRIVCEGFPCTEAVCVTPTPEDGYLYRIYMEKMKAEKKKRV